MSNTQKYIGIDVGKDWLDVACFGEAEVRQVPNTSEGFCQIVAWLRVWKPALVVVEATGGYEQPLVWRLLEAGWRMAVAKRQKARPSPYLWRSKARSACLVRLLTNNTVTASTRKGAPALSHALIRRRSDCQREAIPYIVEEIASPTLRSGQAAGTVYTEQSEVPASQRRHRMNCVSPIKMQPPIHN